LPAEPIPNLAPDLAVEVLSEGSTLGEMERKLHDYFAAGTRLAWVIEPATRMAEACSSPHQCTLVAEDGVLDGVDLLPGFELPLRTVFFRAGQRRS